MSKTYTVVDNVNAERSRNGLSKTDFCKVIGINRKTFTQWEEKGMMPLPKLMLCTKIFDCTTDYLLRNVDEEKPVIDVVQS